MGGSFTFLSPIVLGVFLIILVPSFDLDSGFFFLEGGPGRESISKRQATSSGVNFFPEGIVNLSSIWRDCFSVRTFFCLFSAMIVEMSL